MFPYHLKRPLWAALRAAPPLYARITSHIREFEQPFLTGTLYYDLASYQHVSRQNKMKAHLLHSGFYS